MHSSIRDLARPHQPTLLRSLVNSSSLRNSSRHQIKDYGVGLLAVLVEVVAPSPCAGLPCTHKSINP
jgi:hypothetical protein